MKEKIIKILKFNKYYILFFIIMCILSYLFNFFFNEYIYKIDNTVMSFVSNNLKDNRLTSSIKFITNFGDIIVFSTIIITTFIFLKNKRYSIYLFCNLSLSFLLNTFLKFIFQRVRPIDKLIEASGYSYPSGHTMCSTSFYGLLLYFLVKSTDKKSLKIIYSCIFCLIILIISFSRIYLNVHYFSDIIGGIIFGIISLILFIKALKCLNEPKKL